MCIFEHKIQFYFFSHILLKYYSVYGIVLQYVNLVACSFECKRSII